MKIKKKILMITRSLQRAGAEKYLYELATNFDSTKFDVQILTKYEVTTISEFPHIYYWKLLKRNFIIHRILDFPKKRISVKNEEKYNKYIVAIIYKFLHLYNIFLTILNFLRLKRLVQKFDHVIIVDILLIPRVKNLLKYMESFDIHLMCHQIQFNFDIYASLDITKIYKVVYIDPFQLCELDNSKIRISHSFYFPLSVKNIKIPLHEIGNENKKYKNVGIFTRIASNKPLENILLSMQNLTKLDKSFILNIFGFKQEEEYYSKLQSLISELGLNKNVFFRDHSENMINSINEYKISVLWALSIFDFGGYAAIQMSIQGLPLIFSNIQDDDDVLQDVNNANSVFPYFNDPVQLAQFTHDVFSKEYLIELRNKQFEFLYNNNNLTHNMKKYEKYLLEIL